MYIFYTELFSMAGKEISFSIQLLRQKEINVIEFYK
jgi:hypothetical protein